MEVLPTHIPAATLRDHAIYFENPDTGAGFQNPWQPDVLPAFADLVRWKTGRNPLRPRGYRPRAVARPERPLEDFETLRGAPTRILWVGHASFLVEMDGVRVLIDPVFGRAGGLVPRVTPAALAPEALHHVDAVMVTHGHHDHCDVRSLRRLAEVTGGEALFVVPRGLASVLPKECKRRVELSWWQFVQLKDVALHLVPAQHWHRRGVFDLNACLWGGAVLVGTHRVYHSGDTGYFPGFRAIGEVFAGFDVACLPLGAYEPRWFMGPQHMSPEQSLTALDELGARHLLGMHWGAFDLSDEPVDAGPAVLIEAARQRHVDLERLHVVSPGGSLALTDPGSDGTPLVRHRHPVA